jgi:trk system potassium uptake protein
MRYRAYLSERYRLMIGLSGGILGIIGLLCLVPLAVILFYPEELAHAGSFLLTGVPLAILGYSLYRMDGQGPHSGSLTLQEGAVIVTIVWVVAILVGTIPFMISLGLTFPQALFETTSGWTTTGLSVVDVTSAPRIILFYRSFIQLIGGAGFAIISVSAITGAFSASLTGAEGRTDQLAPHVRQSARIVAFIYSGYVIFGITALRIAGMGWFDAVNHGFTAVATGGFSTRAESISYWDSPAIEAVLIVLMLLGSTNFLIAYTFLRRKVRVALRSAELHLMGVVLLLGIGVLLLLVTTAIYPSVGKAVRIAVFEAASALTGTGFSSTSLLPWPATGLLVLILLMSIGGGTGSTAGGIKQLRVYILLKAAAWEVRKAFMPRHIVNEPAIWHGQNRSLLSDQQVRQTAVFVVMYVFLYLVASGVVMAHGYSMQESLFEVASALGTVGLSVGVTQADMPVTLLLTKSLVMLLGRLEILTLVIGLLKIGTDFRTSLAR